MSTSDEARGDEPQQADGPQQQQHPQYRREHIVHHHGNDYYDEQNQQIEKTHRQGQFQVPEHAIIEDSVSAGHADPEVQAAAAAVQSTTSASGQPSSTTTSTTTSSPSAGAPATHPVGFVTPSSYLRLPVQRASPQLVEDRHMTHMDKEQIEGLVSCFLFPLPSLMIFVLSWLGLCIGTRVGLNSERANNYSAEDHPLAD